MGRLKSTFLCAALAALLTACAGSPAVAAPQATAPVLLTFNLETDEDAEALRNLPSKMPATWFVTGAFAERHEELVRKLAATGTIGSLSYSHPDLTSLDEDALHRELQLGRLVLEKVLGASVAWFRAPFLQYDDKVVRAVARLGFRYDSSDQERWARQLTLPELPISNEDGGETLASDFDLIQTRGMDEAQALAWLQRRLDERVPRGRPLVVVLRPRLLAQRPNLLPDFLDLVELRGGQLMTADAYVDRAMSARPQRMGVWVDFSQGEHDIDRLVADVTAAGMTDVYLQAKDPEGNRYYDDPTDGGPVRNDSFTKAAAALKAAGVRVHAWLVVCRDPFLAENHPDWAMTSIDGTVSREWISPANIRARAAVLRTVGDMLDRFVLDGIHLDYIRYPDFDHDFTAGDVAAFRQTYGIEEMPMRQLFDTHYNQWIYWRSTQLAGLAEEVADLVRARRGWTIELSAALYADAATSYRVMEKMGQDYAMLAPHFDAVIPMAYVQEQLRTVEWIENVALAARLRAGNRSVMAGLEAFQRPGQISYTPELFAKSLDASARGYDGRVFYAYGYLFGRGKAGFNLPDGSVAMLPRMPVPTAAPATSSEGRRLSFWMIYPALAIVFLAAGAMAIRGRARRVRRPQRPAPSAER